MVAGLISLMAAVTLGGAFGSASAMVEAIEEDAMLIVIEVEVLDPGDSVVAHLSFEDERLTLPLLDRGDGEFGIRTELEPKNYVVVFETVGTGGESSEPTTLAQMGADLGQAGRSPGTTSPEEEGLSEESQSLLWLAIALGAGSLSLIAFWVLGSRDDEDDADESPEGERAYEEE